MGLLRSEVVAGTTEGIARFEELIRSLNDEEWRAPTRCEGWVVGDVARHVAGTLTAVATGAFEEFALPDHVDRHVGARAGRTPSEIADEIHESAKIGLDFISTFGDEAWNGPSPGGLPGTVGHGVETIWYDAYVHAEDILAALGRPPARGAGMRAAVVYLARELDEQGWGPATLAFDGLPEIPIGHGDGRRVTGDPLPFILAATGRHDPAVIGLEETVNIYRAQ